MHLLEQNPRLGFYQIGNQRYISKLQALMSARSDEWPIWHFNDDVYDSIDWSIEPETDIEMFYRMRAQQLRDRYDYLVLYFSGGADSATVMRSFVDNGIHLDEVVIGHPESGMSAWTNTADPDPNNTASEYELCARPQLERLRIDSPQTRITLNDYFHDMISTYQSDDWIASARDYLHPSFFSRYSKKRLDHVKKICEAGKSVAFIYGIDKPRLALIENQYHCYFIDIIANTSTWDIDCYPNASTEYFYWSPELPQIVVKQSHLIAKWLNQPKNKKFQAVLQWPPRNLKEHAKLKSIFERVVREPLYPKWDFNLFQAGKPSVTIAAEHDYWFFKHHKDTSLFDTWSAGVSHLLGMLDERWLTKDDKGKVNGLTGFISKMRYITDAVQ